MIIIVLKMFKVTLLLVSLLLFEVKICCSSPQCCRFGWISTPTPTVPNKVNESDYHWHDYTGAIPQDALPGGFDKIGNPVYIGKVSYLGLLIPGPVFTTINGTKMYYDYDHSEHNRKENFKIMCTKHPERFQWIETTNSAMAGLEKEGRLIIGGYATKSTYIGRKFINGEMMVGKVQASYDKHAGLHVTDTMKGAYIYDSFQILYYHPHPDILVEPAQLVQANITKENIPIKPEKLVQENVSKEILSGEPAEIIQQNVSKDNTTFEPAQLVQVNVTKETISTEAAKLVEANGNKEILSDEPAGIIQQNVTQESIPVEAANLVQVNVNKENIPDDPTRIIEVNVNKKYDVVVSDSINDSKRPAKIINVNIF